MSGDQKKDVPWGVIFGIITVVLALMTFFWNVTQSMQNAFEVRIMNERNERLNWQNGHGKCK